MSGSIHATTVSTFPAPIIATEGEPPAATPATTQPVSGTGHEVDDRNLKRMAQAATQFAQNGGSIKPKEKTYSVKNEMRKSAEKFISENHSAQLRGEGVVTGSYAEILKKIREKYEEAMKMAEGEGPDKVLGLIMMYETNEAFKEVYKKAMRDLESYQENAKNLSMEVIKKTTDQNQLSRNIAEIRMIDEQVNEMLQAIKREAALFALDGGVLESTKVD